MDRVTRIALLTGFLCVLLLAVALAVDGYLHGAGANRQHPPGQEGAIINAMLGVAFYGPVVWAIGAAGGLSAGLVGEGIRRLRSEHNRTFPP